MSISYASQLEASILLPTQNALLMTKINSINRILGLVLKIFKNSIKKQQLFFTQAIKVISIHFIQVS